MEQEETRAQELFDDIIAGLEAEIANVGVHMAWDAQVRLAYSREIRSMADRLRQEAMDGYITWAEAAERANEARNATMEMLRGRSSPVGRALAEYLKKEGLTLNELIAKKTASKYGPSAIFDNLTERQKNEIFGEIVESAGRSNPAVNAWMRRARFAGRGLVVLSVGVSIYNIYTSDDPLMTAAEEGSVTLGGVGGGIAGGAVAGLACGPGAPVCVTIGAFVGGALGAFGVSLLW